MKKFYFNPTTKVVTINISTIMDDSVAATSEPTSDITHTEEPLF